MRLNIAIIGEKDAGKTTLLKILKLKYAEINNFFEFSNNDEFQEQFNMFDIIFYVTTTDFTFDEKLYEFMIGRIDYNYTSFKKRTQLITCVNKCDKVDYDFKDDEIIFPKDLTVQFDKMKGRIFSIVDKCDDRDQIKAMFNYFVKTTLQYVSIYGKMSQSSNSSITEEEQNKIGVYEYGKNKWSKFTQVTKKTEMTKLFKNISVEEKISSFGYTVDNFLDKLDKIKVLMGNINYFMHKCGESFVGNEDKLYIEYFSHFLSCKISKNKTVKDTLVNNFETNLIKYYENFFVKDENYILEDLDKLVHCLNRTLSNSKYFSENMLKITKEKKESCQTYINELVLKDLTPDTKFEEILTKIKLLQKNNYTKINSIIEQHVTGNVRFEEILFDSQKVIECFNIIQENCEKTHVVITCIQILDKRIKKIMESKMTNASFLTQLMLSKDYLKTYVNSKQVAKEQRCELQRLSYLTDLCIIALSTQVNLINDMTIDSGQIINKNDVLAVEMYLIKLLTCNNVINTKTISEESDEESDEESEEESEEDNNCESDSDNDDDSEDNDESSIQKSK
jgi:hypothetical protein